MENFVLSALGQLVLESRKRLYENRPGTGSLSSLKVNIDRAPVEQQVHLIRHSRISEGDGIAARFTKRRQQTFEIFRQEWQRRRDEAPFVFIRKPEPQKDLAPRYGNHKFAVVGQKDLTMRAARSHAMTMLSEITYHRVVCIRYNGIDNRWERFLRRKKIWVPIPPPQAPTRGLFPGDLGSIIRSGADGGRELVAARWGLQSSFAKSATTGKRFCYNARMEGSEERGEGIENMSTYRVPFKKTRCVVPAECFYERIGPPKQQRWIRVRRADEEPLLLAGLWSPPNEWTDLPTFAIITTAPPSDYIHDRIPVDFEDGEDLAWQSPDAPIDGLKAMLFYRDPARLIVEEFEPVTYKTKPVLPPNGQVETLF